MRPFASALVLLLAAAGCGRSGAPSGGGTGEIIPVPRPPSIVDPGETFVWHSWNAEITDNVAMVLDTNEGLAATLQFYIGGSDDSVQPGVALDTWASVHPNAPQNAGTVVMTEAEDFPYAGKNLTARTGADPAPSGVFDFQMHARDGDRYVVAAFETPLQGEYVVSGFAAHRLLPAGTNSAAVLLLGSDPQDVLRFVVAESDMLWVSDPGGDLDLGTLPAGEHICFGIHPGAGESALDDATEIAFTITLTAD